jgi:ankyrin repeat protein
LTWIDQFIRSKKIDKENAYKDCHDPLGYGSFFITFTMVMDNKEELFNQIRNGNSKAMEILLKNNPKFLEIQDERGSTPLLLAAYYGHVDMVEFLLDKGAQVDALDGSGNTALMGVCFKGFTPIAEKLINAGANVNQKNAMGATCLIYAVTFNRKEIAELLLKNGADASVKDARGKTAMDLVMEQGNNELEDLLKKY